MFMYISLLIKLIYVKYLENYWTQNEFLVNAFQLVSQEADNKWKLACRRFADAFIVVLGKLWYMLNTNVVQWGAHSELFHFG